MSGGHRHAGDHGHGPANERIFLLIPVLASMLAFCVTLGRAGFALGVIERHALTVAQLF